MEWLLTTLKWYGYLFVLGIIFYPLTKKLFHRFFDSGYAFSKTLAIICITYTSFLLSNFKILPFGQIELLIIAAVYFLINIVIAIKESDIQPTTKNAVTITLSTSFLTRKKFFIIVFEELLFLAGLIFLTYIRGQEPSLRGLEKFMDFGFMNSIGRARFFPPLDMWYSGDPSHPAGYAINYYYFGHLSGEMLIKLTNTLPFIGYNLVLATILGQGLVMGFSLAGNMIYAVKKYILKQKKTMVHVFTFGLLGSLIMNLGGNLHTIYLFTSGYPNESPIPFWKIMGGFNPSKYWYPNATRFIPYTIHEFPSYSYVVSDLHGHVFDIPFVLFTLALLFAFYFNYKVRNEPEEQPVVEHPKKHKRVHEAVHTVVAKVKPFSTFASIIASILVGCMAAIHYMTNAFDGPIYILLALVVFFFVYGKSVKYLLYSGLMIVSFVVFSYPFSSHFAPFVSGIGVNCSPDFLVKLVKIGPFMFEKGKCQVSPFWMLFVLWGFFWINFAIMMGIYLTRKNTKEQNVVDQFILMLFFFGTYLIIIPEFFYIKDIYPDHFRANTMFKLGYQAFIIMSLSSAYVMYRIRTLKTKFKYVLKLVILGPVFLVLLYSFYSFPSYYGDLKKPVELDGSVWIKDSYPEAKEIIDYANSSIKGQPTILEAQGDSYTDYELVSAYTGLPTVAGWWVHEWLWRGTSEVVGNRIPDIENMYESDDLDLTRDLLKKYHVKYVVVTSQERTKYPKIKEEKFSKLGTKIFESSNKFGALYKVN